MSSISTNRVPTAPSARAGEDEHRLVRALRAGKEEAFASLVDRHHSTMKRVARAYVGSDAVAEEVVQDTWTAVLAGLERFEERSSLRTWIFRILVNRAMTEGARERRCLPFSAFEATDDSEPSVAADRFLGAESPWPGHWAAPPRPWTDPDTRLLSLEARERLREAIDDLPARQQLVLTLSDVEGMSADEVCGLLDLEHGNQRVLLHRARSKLRNALEGYLDDES